MNKNLTLWVILLALIITFGVHSPIALADEEYYWEDFMETAAIQYDLHESELEFFTKITEKNAGETVDNGMDTELDFYFGILKNGQLHSYFYSEDSYTNIIGEYKHRLIDGKNLDVSTKARLFYLKNEFSAPSIKVLTDKPIGKNMVVHNNLQLFFWGSGVIGKRIENGLTYNINSRNFLKMRLKTSFDADITEGTFDFRVAYKNIVNDQTNLILYGYYEKDEDQLKNGNLHLESIVKFWPIKPLEISINAIINTAEVKSNWVVVRGEYTFSEQWLIETEYHKELIKDGYRYVKSGFTFKL